MKPCWSFWTLLNTNLVGILLKMAMLKFLIVQNPWELQINIMTERSSTWGLLLWREKESGGYLRWIMTWTRNSLPQFGRRSWSSCFYLLTFRTHIPCHDTTVDTWDCWRTLATFHGPCEWQQCQGKKTNWHVLSSCWWLVHFLALQSFWEVQESCQVTIQDWTWRYAWLVMFTGQRVKWVIDEKTKKKSHIAVEQSLCVSELTEVVISPKGLKDEETSDKNLHIAYRSLLGSINWLQSRTQFSVMLSVLTLCFCSCLTYYRWL